MAWSVRFSKTAAKQIKKLDKTVQARVFSFLHKNLDNTKNPRSLGKALKGEKKELWRYRVGDYRLICNINDGSVTVLVLAVSHRKNVYR